MNNRVMVIEDNELAFKMVCMVLQNAGYETLAKNGHFDISNGSTPTKIDLAIISVEQGDTNGFAIYRQMRSEGYGGPVIFTSECTDVSRKLEAFELGADDYIVKPYDPLELLARVESVIRRFEIAEIRARERLIRVGDAQLSVGKLTYTSAVVPETVLTPTEMKILECLMRNHGITISRSMLNERVRGFESSGDTNRVDVYIRRVRRKIETDPANPEYLRTVRGLGYVFSGKRPAISQSTPLSAISSSDDSD